MENINSKNSSGATLMPVRAWLQLEGLAVLSISVFLYARSGASWWLLALLLLSPDLSMLPYLVNPRVGAMAYNAAHSYLAPLCLTAFSLGLHMQVRMMPYLLIWIAHIGMDRMMGYGLKYPHAFKATHLSSGS